ncbi:MAG: hypothetical protein RMI49_00760 [Candidatus Caldarchaeum sp.]|nr:hypothetical protein [Candidatus Caldarchaeum sp.]
MRSFAATMTAMSVLMVFGGLMARDILQTLPTTGYQTIIFAVILSSLSTLLTPLSSAVGTSTYVPPNATPVFLGLWPLTAWILAGVSIGMLTQKTKESIIPPLITSTLTYLAVIGLAIYTLPKIPNAINWENYIGKLAQQMILDGPLDFAFLFILPLSAAVVTSFIAEAFRPKPMVREPLVRRRFWEWSSED